MGFLRLGLIGAGKRGNLALHAHRPDGDSRIVAVCDSDIHARERAKKVYGDDIFVTSNLNAMLDEDLDGVFVCSPDNLHEDHACFVLSRGVSVFLEKPMAITIDGCDRVLAAARASEAKLFVGHNMRYMTIIRKMKNLIDSGIIGKVKSVWCRHFISYGGDAYFRDWHSQRKNTTSLLLQKGAHDIDVIHWLCGKFTKRVSAMGNNAVYHKLPKRQPHEIGDVTFNTDHWPPMSQKDFSPIIDVEDQSMVLMELEDGILANYMQCHFTPDSCRNYTVIGTKGRLENIGDGPDSPIFVWNKRSNDYRMIGDEVHRGDPASSGGHGGADPVIVQEFLDYISGQRKKTTATPRAARMSVAVGYQATMSLRSGGVPMDIPPIPQELC